MFIIDYLGAKAGLLMDHAGMGVLKFIVSNDMFLCGGIMFLVMLWMLGVDHAGLWAKCLFGVYFIILLVVM